MIKLEDLRVGMRIRYKFDLKDGSVQQERVGQILVIHTDGRPWPIEAEDPLPCEKPETCNCKTGDIYEDSCFIDVSEILEVLYDA